MAQAWSGPPRRDSLQCLANLSSFTLYLRLVTAAGAVAVVGLALVGATDIGPLDAEFWVLAALVLLGELFPIQVHGQVGEETFSTPFAFAMLLVVRRAGGRGRAGRGRRCSRT